MCLGDGLRRQPGGRADRRPSDRVAREARCARPRSRARDRARRLRSLGVGTLDARPEAPVLATTAQGRVRAYGSLFVRGAYRRERSAERSTSRDPTAHPRLRPVCSRLRRLARSRPAARLGCCSGSPRVRLRGARRSRHRVEALTRQRSRPQGPVRRRFGCPQNPASAGQPGGWTTLEGDGGTWLRVQSATPRGEVVPTAT